MTGPQPIPAPRAGEWFRPGGHDRPTRAQLSAAALEVLDTIEAMDMVPGQPTRTPEDVAAQAFKIFISGLPLRRRLAYSWMAISARWRRATWMTPVTLRQLTDLSD